jgi:hypothetical protein
VPLAPPPTTATSSIWLSPWIPVPHAGRIIYLPIDK